MNLVESGSHALRLDQKRLRSLALLAGILIWFAAVLTSARYATLNGDEGWYLTASDLAVRGGLPYRDFAFTQTPLLPYVYGLLLSLTGTSLATGRFITVFCSTLAVALTLMLARHVGQDKSLWLTFVLLIATPATLYFFAILKTYALTSLFALFALYCIFRFKPPAHFLIPFASVLAAGLAAATRLSLLTLFGLVCLYWLVRGQRKAVVLGVCLILIPLGLLAYLSNGNILFDIFEFHLMRPQDETTAAILNTPKILLAGRTGLGFTSVIILSLLLLFLILRSSQVRMKTAEWFRRERLEKIIWLGASSSLAIVDFLPSANLWEYQVPTFVISLPWLAALTTILIPEHKPWATLSFLTIVVIGATLPSWAFQFESLFGPENAIERAVKLSEILEHNGSAGDQVLGAYGHLALAARMKIPEGNEMGSFSVTDELSATEAGQRHLLTATQVTNILESCAVSFVVTDDGERIFLFSVPSIEYLSDSIWERWRQLLNTNYEIIYADSTNLIFKRQPEKCALIAH